MRTLVLLLACGLAAAPQTGVGFAEVYKINIEWLRSLGAPGIPPGAMDQIQIMIRDQEAPRDAYLIRAEGHGKQGEPWSDETLVRRLPTSDYLADGMATFRVLNADDITVKRIIVTPLKAEAPQVYDK